jgi:hypothetical protein
MRAPLMCAINANKESIPVYISVHWRQLAVPVSIARWRCVDLVLVRAVDTSAGWLRIAGAQMQAR